MKNFSSPRCPPPSTVQSMDVLLHVENGRPKRPNTDNHGTYVEDGLRPSQKERLNFISFRRPCSSNGYIYRDVQQT